MGQPDVAPFLEDDVPTQDRQPYEEEKRCQSDTAGSHQERLKTPIMRFWI